MLHSAVNTEDILPIGESGRIVIEVDTVLKRKLYSVLALEGQTLKDWFSKAASDYLRSTLASPTPRPKKRQPSF